MDPTTVVCICVIVFWAIAGLYMVATDALWSGPITRFLWSVIRRILYAAILIVIFIWVAHV